MRWKFLLIICQTPVRRYAEILVALLVFARTSSPHYQPVGMEWEV